MNRRDFIVQTGVATAGLLMAPSEGFKEVTRKPDRVIIIGGGLAGLTAAYELRKAGVDLLVLEGSNRLGGRVVTTHNFGTVTELGAEWIGFGHSSVRRLCSELQLPLTQHRFSTHLLINGVYCKPGSYPAESTGSSTKSPFRSTSVFSLPNNEMDFKVSGGNYRLIEKMARKLSPVQVKTGSQVLKVIDNGKEFTIICLNRKLYKASNVICALPAPFIKSIKWEPALPEAFIHSISQSEYQTCLKISVGFNERIWADNDFEMVSDEILPYVYNSSAESNCLTFSASGEKAKKILQLNHWGRKQAIISTLKPAFGNVANHITSINYYAGPDASKMTSYGSLNPENIIDIDMQERLLFCGDYLTSYRGFMEASVRSAKIATKQLLTS